MKVCKTCRIEKSNVEYTKCKAAKDGLAYVCNKCRAEYELKRRVAKGIKPKIKPLILDEKHKECLKCREVKSSADFNKNPRGRLGVSAYCKICDAIYHKEFRKRNIKLQRFLQKKATQKYRNLHREHWRGLHRINQFNRKNLIKVNTDGTVTEEFMINLYQTKRCCWCNKRTPFSERTAEHIVPLVKGGVHGISNLKMACLSCNSSKINFKI